MRRVVCIGALSLMLVGCVSPYITAGLGRINRPINTVWVGEDKFVYVPGPTGKNFTFETANGRIIEPGMMYTDGGSIPRLAQIFKGFSPWGFGPAYIIHDWIFYAQHCYIDRREIDKEGYDAIRFRDVYGYGDYRKIEFGDSATILAEVIKTIIDDREVQPQNVPATLISSAVDSVFALALWNEADACERQRVSAEHIAILWVRHNGGEGDRPPGTWKLSGDEAKDARRYLGRARCLVATVVPGRPRLCPPPPKLSEVIAKEM